MDTQLVFRKTSLGTEEIKSRVKKLDRKLRMILIAVNGKDTIEKLDTVFSKMPSYEGSKDFFACLQALRDQGFITATNERLEKISSAYGMGEWQEEKALAVKLKLTSVVKEVLGKYAPKVLLKLDNAPNTKEGIVVAIDEIEKYVRLFIDDQKDKVLANKCRSVLSENT